VVCCCSELNCILQIIQNTGMFNGQELIKLVFVDGTVQYSVTAHCLEEWRVPDKDTWNCIMDKVKCAKENVVS